MNWNPPENIFEKWYYSNGKVYLIISNELLDHLKKKCGENSLTHACYLCEEIEQDVSVLECVVVYPQQQGNDRK